MPVFFFSLNEHIAFFVCMHIKLIDIIDSDKGLLFCSK